MKRCDKYSLIINLTVFFCHNKYNSGRRGFSRDLSYFAAKAPPTQCFIILIFLFYFLSQTVSAELIDNKITPPTWTLSAKPRFCVLPYDKRVCNMSADLNWVGTQEANICLLSSQDNDVLKCWLGAIKGQVLQEINSDKLISFWLTFEGEEAVLVKTTIRIISIPQKRVRKRRRHIWSLL